MDWLKASRSCTNIFPRHNDVNYGRVRVVCTHLCHCMLLSLGHRSSRCVFSFLFQMAIKDDMFCFSHDWLHGLVFYVFMASTSAPLHRFVRCHLRGVFIKSVSAFAFLCSFSPVAVDSEASAFVDWCCKNWSIGVVFHSEHAYKRYRGA